MQSITKLNRQKGAIKAKITALELYVENFIETEQSSVQLTVKLNSVKKLQERLNTLLSDYQDLPDEVELGEIETAIDELEIKLENIEVSVKYLLNKLKLNVCNNNNAGGKNESSLSANVRLPEIPLPKFSGKYQEWSQFKLQFTNLIADNEKLSDIQKLYYLRAAIEGEAKRLESVDDTYESLFKALEERYENKRILVDTHIQALINYEKIVNESSKDLRNLIDCINKNLRGLNVLEYKRNNLSDIMLINIILNKLDKETRRQYELTLKSKEVPSLDEFLSYLESRSMTLESVNRNFTLKNNYKGSYNQSNRVKSLVISSKEIKCILCGGFHPLETCLNFRKMDISARYEVIKRNKLCRNCLLQSHVALACRNTKYYCNICFKKHHTLLHRSENMEYQSESKVRSHDSTNCNIAAAGGHKFDPPPPETLQVEGVWNHGNKIQEKIVTAVSSENKLGSSTVLLSTVMVYVRNVNGLLIKIKALLDSASQLNLITNSCAEKLGLKKKFRKALIAGVNGSTHSAKAKTIVNISNKQNTFRQNIECVIIPKLTDVYPPTKLDVSKIELPDYVELADPDYFIPSQIDLLIGSDLFFEILKEGRLRTLDGNLILQNTQFGYLIAGSLPQESKSNYCCLVNEINLDQKLQKFFDSELIPQNEDLIKSKEEIMCEEHFLITHKRDERGRYIVEMPLFKDPKCLGDSKSNALRQLDSLWKRLNKNPELLNLYRDFINEYISLGHMEEVLVEEEPEIVYYLPHHGVYREENRSTPLRVVFNASALTSSGESLNSIQMNGGVIQDDLFSILLRFRKYKYAFTADIKKMYRMVWIEDSQRDLLRVVWKWGLNEPIKIYKLCTITYGTTCAPFLATRALKQLAVDEGISFPVAAEIAQRDFYMDDVLSGNQQLEDAKELQFQLIKLLERGGMTLHKWHSNHVELLPDSSQINEDYALFSSPNETKALGLWWSPTEDSLLFKIKIDSQEVFTKRTVLSEIASIFDPLGLIGPIVSRAKIFMQKLWLLEMQWNDQLPKKESQEWENILTSLEAVNEIRIDRYVPQEDIVNVQLHGFADASERAYGAVVYLKCISSKGKISMSILCSKSRVAPIKTVTIPRLELCAALLLSRLVKKIQSSFQCATDKIYLWTDSTIVLAWIKKFPHLLKTFVSNRVATIQELTKDCVWQHINSECNPADLVSRGVDAKELQGNELWWRGPEFLRQNITCQASDVELEQLDDELYSRELKSISENNLKTVLFTSEFPSISDKLFKQTNNYCTLIRVISYIFRFYFNSRYPSRKRSGHLTSRELQEGEQALIRLVQREVFSKEIGNLKMGLPVPNKSKLKSLFPFLDDGEILRVGGRLENANLNYNKRHQIVLPGKHKLTEVIIEYFHKKYFHVGAQSLLYYVRQKFWPISGRSLCRKIVHNCVICLEPNQLHANK